MQSDELQEIKEKNKATRNSAFPIATNKVTENKLNELRLNGVNTKHFNPDTIDLFGLHIKVKNKLDPIKGFNRLLNNQKYITLITNLIHNAAIAHPNKRIRQLTILPPNYPSYNNLRDAFIDIQNNAGLLENFIFTEASETKTAIQNYANSLENPKNCTLVLDENTTLRNFTPSIDFGLDEFNEIVIMYRNWDKNHLHYQYLQTLSKIDRKKIHFARIPLSINQYSREEIISNILIAEGFKSISFKNPEIPPVMIKYIKNKPRKDQSQKLDDAVWVDTNIMDYVPDHPQGCCINNSSIKNLGVDNCIHFHNMEKLSEVYNKILQNATERKRVLQLQSMQPIVRKIGIVV